MKAGSVGAALRSKPSTAANPAARPEFSRLAHSSPEPLALDHWPLACELLPSGWQKQARRLSVLRRARGFPDAAALSRTVLVQLASGAKTSIVKLTSMGRCPGLSCATHFGVEEDRGHSVAQWNRQDRFALSTSAFHYPRIGGLKEAGDRKFNLCAIQT